MAKSKKNNDSNNYFVFIGIVAAVLVIAVIIGVVAMNNRGGGDEGGSDSNGPVVIDDGNSLSASDLENVDVTIEYGDYDGMYDLSKSIQNGEMVGQVVQIEGDVSHPMSTYSIVQRNDEDSASIGTQFVIEGDAEYPEDGAHVIITGKVIEQSPMYFVIQTLPEFIEVQ